MLLNARGEPISSGPPVFSEIASAAKDDIAAGFIGELRQVQDEILLGLPGGAKAYRKLLSDDQVQSTYQQRRRAMISRSWSVEPGGTGKLDQMAADWLKEQIDHVGWDRVCDRMHFGVFYGHAVAELMYAREGPYINVDEIKVRDRFRFRFDRNDELRLLTREHQQGEVMPPRKFWTFATGSDHDDDPYGIGLAHYLYWPVYFKRGGVKFWLSFMERFATPTPIGKYQPGTELSEQRKLLQALQSLTADAAIILPEGMNVDKFEANRTGTNSYEPFYDKMNAAIAKIVLSQTMTTDAASTGLGSTQGSVQADVAEAVQKGDSDLICSSFNSGTPFSEGPVQWLTEWNFPGAEPPTFYYDFEEEEDLTARVERDHKLFSIGYELTEEKQLEVYGEGYRRKASAPPPALPAPAAAATIAEFAEGESFTRQMAGRLQPSADQVVAGWIAQARELLSTSGTLTEFSERLLEMHPGLSGDALTALMGDAMNASALAGRYEVHRGN